MDAENKRLLDFVNDPTREARFTQSELSDPLNTMGGYLTGTMSATAAVLNIEYLPPSPAIQSKFLRLAMSRAQCTELGDALKRLAVPHHNPNAARN